MTALERAKAFINSRAAKTALRIMPLAVAAAVAVTAVPKANATAATLTGTFEQWTYHHCSGGAGICHPVESTSFNYPGGGAVTGSGSLAGTEGLGGGDQSMDFFIQGSGTGNYNDNVAFGGSFLVNCTGCATGESFSYDVTATIDGTPYSSPLNIPFTPGSTVTLPTVLIPTTNGDDVSLDLWSADIVFHWDNSTAGDQISFDPVNLTLNPLNPTTPTVPEPASMLLALSGLPFLRRLLRKR